MFRIVHVAAAGHAPAAYRDQTVEVALGPNPAFPTSRIGSFTRRVAADRMVTGATPRRSKPKRPNEPRSPRVVELLRKAQAWRAMLDSGAVTNQAELARREGVTRARVTQVMGLLRLTPAIQRHVLSLPRTSRRSGISERALRLVASLCPDEQLPEFASLLDAAPKEPKETALFGGEVATG